MLSLATQWQVTCLVIVPLRFAHTPRARRILAAPAPHKQAYDTFLKAAGLLLGGELGGEELYASAAQLYDTLSAAPVPDEQAELTN